MKDMSSVAEILIGLGGLVMILLVLLPYSVLKRPKANASDTDYTSVPLLSYGFAISLSTIPVSVVLFIVFGFTARLTPDSVHSFGVECSGGGHRYIHPVLAIAAMTTLCIAGVTGALNYICLVWYQRKHNLKKLNLPIIGRFDLK